MSCTMRLPCACVLGLTLFKSLAVPAARQPTNLGVQAAGQRSCCGGAIKRPQQQVCPVDPICHNGSAGKTAS